MIKLKKHQFVSIAATITATVAAASLAAKGQSPAVAENDSTLPVVREWIIPPEPQNSDPQAWLDRILKIRDDEAEITQAMAQHPELNGKMTDIFNRQGLLDERTVLKLISFGKPSIKPCIADLVKERNHDISYQVLAGLGDLSVAPLTKLMFDKPDCIPDIYQIFMQMNKNTSNELVRLACQPGDTRAGAIDILAYMAKSYEGTDETDNCALARPNAVDDKKRQPLLDQLKGEKTVKVRANLVTAQRIFKSPNDNVIAVISKLLRSDPSNDVKKAAAETLQQQLQASTQKGSPAIVNAITEALDAGNDNDTKIACCNAFCVTRFPVEALSVNALKKTASENAADSFLKFAAQRALSHQAIFNEQCFDDMLESLKSNDYPVMAMALDSCITLGPKALAALPYLSRIERDNTFSMRQKAKEAIAAIQANSTQEKDDEQ